MRHPTACDQCRTWRDTPCWPACVWDPMPPLDGDIARIAAEAMNTVDAQTMSVGEALRAACIREFGTAWSYDTAWRFARAAIAAMHDT